MKRAISTLLIGSLATMTVAGCGTPAALGVQGGSPSTLGAQDLTASQMAQAFAKQISSQTAMNPIVQGDVVEVQTADGQIATYDFSRVPQTGNVTFTAGGLSTQFQWNTGVSPQLFPLPLPLMLIAVAVKVVWGGAVAFGKYYFSHRHTFDDKDCAIAVMNGMVSESLGSIPIVGGLISGLLWPIAQKWVDSWMGKHLPFKAQDVLSEGMKFHSDVVEALKAAMAKSPQASYAQ